MTLVRRNALWRLRPPCWLVGLLLLLCSARLPASAELNKERPPNEPLALALAPLGPVKSLLLAGLWVDALQRHQRGELERAAFMARVLLEVDPQADAAREFLASQLIATEAARAPDRIRHLALLQAGLALLEEGRAARPSARLSGALGRLLATRRGLDPLLAEAVEAYYGESLETIAREALAEGDEPAVDGVLLIELHIERGLRRLESGEGPGAAAVELAAAERILADMPTGVAEDYGLIDALEAFRATLHQEEP
ncbi:MAG: hypothetical protein ACT4PU_00950 [Planctomycetota bacterium]